MAQANGPPPFNHYGATRDLTADLPSCNLLALTRLLAFTLALCVLAVGTGVAEYLHDLGHDVEDAAADVAAERAGKSLPDHPQHDESNCPTHFALHAPLLSGHGYVPLLILLGLLIAFLTELPARARICCITFRLHCRGPPAPAY